LAAVPKYSAILWVGFFLILSSTKNLLWVRRLAMSTGAAWQRVGDGYRAAPHGATKWKEHALHDLGSLTASGFEAAKAKVLSLTAGLNK